MALTDTAEPVFKLADKSEAVTWRPYDLRNAILTGRLARDLEDEIERHYPEHHHPKGS